MKIEGIVTNIIYRNEDNGYNIIVVETSDSDITCVGTMPFFDQGDNVEVIGELIYHDKYGEQINVSSIKLLKPSGKDAIINYLSNANIKGVGRKTAKQIYSEFGEDSIDIVYNDPEKLKTISGIGKKKIEDIKLTTEQTKDSRSSLLYLQSLNISYKLSMKIYKLYGEDTIDIIKLNPYKLVDDISGVGFTMADNIARNMQINSNSAFRISAGISHILNYESELNGHTTIKKDFLINKVSKLLKVNTIEVSDQIKKDSITGKLYIVEIKDEEFVYKKSLYKAEIINAIKKILNNNDLTYSLLAPTGRAAKRIQESTGDEAYTIHRLLGIKPDEPLAEYNEENPIDKDYIIVDEMSMVDIYLMESLISAISPNTALIMVGDSNQLPSVGPGNVLADIINTDIKTIKLKKIFRQGLKSNIIVNAHKINKGEYPILNELGKDFFFIEANKNNFSQVLADLVNNRLPKFYGLDKIKDIQILCPSKKTAWGSTNINNNIQNILNPSDKKIVINEKNFKLNDKVMQIRNNYDLVAENSLSSNL